MNIWLVEKKTWFWLDDFSFVFCVYLRPVSGCINAGCVAVVAVLGCGFGLLTFVLLLANSKRIVCGISGSNRTPCCNFVFCCIFFLLFWSVISLKLDELYLDLNV